MNVRFLETFLWVARLRSFRRAADRLHSTQAAVSARIAALEEDLDVRLFDREAREVTLTAAGWLALEHAERVTAAAQALRSVLTDPRALRGHVRLGVMDSVIHTWLIELMRDLRQSYPQLEIELQADTALHLTEQLAKGQLDLAVQTDWVREDWVRNHALCTYRMHWIAAPGWQPPATPVTIGALAGERIVTFARNSRPHQAVLSLMHGAGITAPKVSCVNSAAAMIRLVQEGFGIGALPALLVRDELARGELALVDVVEHMPELDLVVAWHTRAGMEWPERVVAVMRNTVQRFCTEVGAQYATLPPPAEPH